MGLENHLSVFFGNPFSLKIYLKWFFFMKKLINHKFWWLIVSQRDRKIQSWEKLTVGHKIYLGNTQKWEESYCSKISFCWHLQIWIIFHKIFIFSSFSLKTPKQIVSNIFFCSPNFFLFHFPSIFGQRFFSMGLSKSSFIYKLLNIRTFFFLLFSTIEMQIFILWDFLKWIMFWRKLMFPWFMVLLWFSSGL